MPVPSQTYARAEATPGRTASAWQHTPGFGVARRAPFGSCPGELPRPLCHTAGCGADPRPHAPSHGLQPLSLGTRRWHRRSLLPHLLSASKPFLISLGRELNSFFRLLSLSSGQCLQSFVLIPPPFVPSRPDPLLISSLTCPSSISPRPACVFILMLLFIAPQSTCTCRNVSDTGGSAGLSVLL